MRDNSRFSSDYQKSLSEFYIKEKQYEKVVIQRDIFNKKIKNDPGFFSLQKFKVLKESQHSINLPSDYVKSKKGVTEDKFFYA